MPVSICQPYPYGGRRSPSMTLMIQVPILLSLTLLVCIPFQFPPCIFHVFSMQKPFMRIPYTGPLPPPVIIPRNANTPTGAISALSKFLSAPRSKHLSQASRAHDSQTVLLTGAGISVASGLADYRGTGGTYTLNKTYRPIYYNEFTSNHEARKRYWARSFLGWTNLHKARPNKGHQAVQELGNLGIVSSIITQSLSIP